MRDVLNEKYGLTRLRHNDPLVDPNRHTVIKGDYISVEFDDVVGDGTYEYPFATTQSQEHMVDESEGARLLSDILRSHSRKRTFP